MSALSRWAFYVCLFCWAVWALGHVYGARSLERVWDAAGVVAIVAGMVSLVAFVVSRLRRAGGVR